MRPVCEGSGISWEIKDNTLFLEGSGKMEFPLESDRLSIPWYYEDFDHVSFKGDILSIGPEAFHTSDLVEADIPDTAREVCQLAFCSCRSLRRISFGRHVTDIGPYAFEDCICLKRVRLGGCVKTLGYSAFEGCTDLVSFEPSPLLRSIGERCFAGCTSLRRIAIFRTTERIAGNPFSDCTSLEEISVEETNPAYSSADGCLFNKARSVLMAVPGGRSGDLIVPDSVVEIGRDAVRGCSVSTVTVPRKVRFIETGAFAGCRNLFHADLGRCAEDTVRGDLFRSCTSLEDVTLPENTSVIEFNAFRNCTSLREIALPGTLERIGENAFKGCTALERLKLPDGLQCIGEEAFGNCTSLKEIKFNDGLVSIGRNAFRGCTSLTEVVIPESVVEIEDGAFKGCTSLRTVRLPTEYGNEGSFLPDRSDIYRADNDGA